jgi:large subunit ribosomal protein L6
MHGLTRALLNNMVLGVSEGYSKVLEIVGTGYRAEKQGEKLVLYLGHSHPIEFSPP